MKIFNEDFEVYLIHNAVDVLEHCENHNPFKRNIETLLYNPDKKPQCNMRIICWPQYFMTLESS